MSLSKNVFSLVLLSVLINSSVFAEGMTFALVAKSIDDGNFIDTWKGCNELAKQSGDQCVLLGGKGASNLRLQQLIIQKAVKSKRYDAFAISVINSEFVAKALKDADVPVITFDSPFSENFKHFSHAYVGIDNLEFGKELARIAKRLNPDGKSVCLMTAMHDHNLSLRMLGIRQVLSDNHHLKDNNRLEGDGGWAEYNRCPWNVADNVERSLNQLEFTLNSIKPDVFLSVGHWPILNVERYRMITEPFREDIINNKHILLFNIGSQSMETTEELMNEGLLNGFVSINFPEIGRQSYKIMKRITEGKPVNSANYIPNIIRVRE